MFIGKAQEKTSVFRTERRRNEQTGATYPWLVRLGVAGDVIERFEFAKDRDID